MCSIGHSSDGSTCSLCNKESCCDRVGKTGGHLCAALGQYVRLYCTVRSTARSVGIGCHRLLYDVSVHRQ